MYKLVVIGCGSIGALKDNKYDNKVSRNILTQANAAYRHSLIDLCAVCDLDMNKAKKAAEKWNTISYDNYRKMINEIKPDIVSICTDTSVHSIILKDLIKFSNWLPKLVICEKPFCEDIKQAKEINKLYKSLNIPILIDYIRRFDERIRETKQLIKNSIIYGIKVIYNRGLYHEGCHAIDLLNFLIGDCKEIENLSERKDYIIDRNINDPSIMARLKYKRCNNVFMFPVDGNVASIFEIDIITDSGRYQFVDHGNKLFFWPIVKEKTYGNYNSFDDYPVFHSIYLTTALYNLMHNAINYLLGFEPLFCTDKDALKVHEIIKKLGRT